MHSLNKSLDLLMIMGMLQACVFVVEIFPNKLNQDVFCFLALEKRNGSSSRVIKDSLI